VLLARAAEGVSAENRANTELEEPMTVRLSECDDHGCVEISDFSGRV